MDCCKEKHGPRYTANREIQAEIENIQVEPNINLICLGDFNGKIHALEPQIKSDPNGQMI